MQSKLTTLLAISALVLGLGACTQENSELNRAPGKYERSSSSTDANGTTIKRESSTDVEYDDSGRKRAVVKSKTTKDPKGLFNKTTSKSKRVIQER